MSTECSQAVAGAGFQATGADVRKNDLVWSVRTPGFAPSWNRVVATDAATVTFANGARVTRAWLGGVVTLFRPRVILGGA